MADKQLNEQQLQALLRLKRFEQPPPGYYDNLLVSIQMRQREQMLEPHSLSRAGWDRVKTWFSSFEVDWGYAASMAGILLMGIGAIQIALPRRLSVVETSAPTPSLMVSTRSQAPEIPMLSMQPSDRKHLVQEYQAVRFDPSQGVREAPTRYVIDPQPVSYRKSQVRF